MKPRLAMVLALTFAAGCSSSSSNDSAPAPASTVPGTEAGPAVTPGDDGGPAVTPESGPVPDDSGPVVNPEGGPGPDDSGPVVPEGGRPDASDAADDPCGDVPPVGRCTSSTAYQWCDTAGAPVVATVDCQAGEACQVGTNGRAACVLTAACRSGDVECKDANTVRTCTNGAWADTATCPNGCVSTGTTAQCAAALSTTAATGRLIFQRRGLNADKTALTEPFDAPGRGFKIVVQRGTTPIATGLTSLTDGSFSIAVPSTLDPTDVVKAIALVEDGAGGIGLTVANPNLPAGKYAEEKAGNANAAVWSWEFPAADLSLNGGVLRISETGHSGGVANVFDQAAATYRAMKTRYSSNPRAMVIWMGADVQWNCGACVGDESGVYWSTRFQNAMWYPADSDRSYYADAVIQHENGHWMTSSFSRSPNEGGDHRMECPTFPGQAFEEGFVTWFGFQAIGNPIYFDIQGGSLFWLDYSNRTTVGAWAPRPTPTGTDVMTSAVPGLLQKVSESEIAAMLWTLSNGVTAADPIYAAWASPRVKTLNVSQAFERGYVRHSWTLSKTNCDMTNVEVSTEPGPMFADLLDALRCAGMSAATVDAATQPQTYFPYPSASPLCR